MINKNDLHVDEKISEISDERENAINCRICLSTKSTI